MSKRCEVVLQPYNVVHFKRCLTVKAQQRLLRECGEIMKMGENPALTSPSKLAKVNSKKALPVLFWNWPAVAPSMTYKDTYDFKPDAILQFAKKLFDTARDTISDQIESDMVIRANKKGMQFPANYSPNALYGILYPEGGSFIPHVDGAKGWALALSVGDSASFYVCETEFSERYHIRIDSGDAVIFKGGILYHGVDAIIPNSAPSFWKNNEIRSFPKMEMVRFNLQFRDPINDRLQYYPVFVADGEDGRHQPLKK